MSPWTVAAVPVPRGPVLLVLGLQLGRVQLDRVPQLGMAGRIGTQRRMRQKGLGDVFGALPMPTHGLDDCARLNSLPIDPRGIAARLPQRRRRPHPEGVLSAAALEQLLDALHPSRRLGVDAGHPATSAAFDLVNSASRAFSASCCCFRACAARISSGVNSSATASSLTTSAFRWATVLA